MHTLKAVTGWTDVIDAIVSTKLFVVGLTLETDLTREAAHHLLTDQVALAFYIAGRACDFVDQCATREKEEPTDAAKNSKAMKSPKHGSSSL